MSIICVPVTADGIVDPRWGRAERVAIVRLIDGDVREWNEFDVGWGTLHEQGPEGLHHARIATFLREQQVGVVVAGHMGPPMANMLDKMGVRVVLGAEGDARRAVEKAGDSNSI